MQFQYVALLLLLTLLIAAEARRKWYKMDTDALERDWAGDENAADDDDEDEVELKGATILVQLKDELSVSLAKLVQKYESMLKSGSLVVAVSELGRDRLQFEVTKAWQSAETMRFLALQPEVQAFATDERKYQPAEYLKSIGEGDDDEDDEL
ncbi:hypothetical protein B484DRAFT_443506 [Ochromonadaceae sp. CCMP2298]|nr:hypothetical protein B484DRAFT_443506 [Ochromonadaceae sp. CCMP2298]|mmetsp:Transcript_20108/g.44704  ORF Transcript_20108/g.44704 Transcript_20108/m.44704 type:complete len:152 (+) Transcript_20108:56-511(+)